MQAVQAPIIPILADLIRRTPGTISLGQGVVSYGPPPEALAALSALPRHAGRSPLRAGGGLAGTRRGHLGQARARERHRSADRTRRVVVTAGGNMAFVNAVLAVTDPGDEVILQAPFYFNHDMAIVIAGCRTVAVPTDDRVPAAAGRDPRGDHAADARRRHHLAEQPDRRGLPGSGAARGERPVRRARALPRPRRGVRVLHVRRRAALLARRVRPAGTTTRSRCSRSRRPTGWPAGGSATWSSPRGCSRRSTRSRTRT